MLHQNTSRLAYRVLTQEAGFPTPFPPELRRGARARMPQLRDVLRRIPKVCVDNVAAWYAGHERFHCRGHFATYTEQAPLFGRYPGTFWVPDHVRGANERGQVTKNYAIQPPDGESCGRAPSDLDNETKREHPCKSTPT